MYQMQSKKIYHSLIFAALFLALSFSIVKAQEQKVDYKGEVIVDSDLDGLTDKGEQQIYGTDAGNPDTDGDGYLDGAEILAGASPLDAQDYPGHSDIDAVSRMIDKETPWAWYLGRAAGIIGFVFLWITIFLGLSIRNPLLKKIIEPIYSFDFHCFMAAAAVFWALIHGTSFLFDEFMGFGIGDITSPYFSQATTVNVSYMALGIMAFYAMTIMTITSYLRSHLNHMLWRVLHFLNPLAFIFVVIHGYSIGTDIKNFYVGSAFLFLSFLLVLIYLSSLTFVIVNRVRQRQADNVIK